LSWCKGANESVNMPVILAQLHGWGFKCLPIEQWGWERILNMEPHKWSYADELTDFGLHEALQNFEKGLEMPQRMQFPDKNCPAPFSGVQENSQSLCLDSSPPLQFLLACQYRRDRAAQNPMWTSACQSVWMKMVIYVYKDDKCNIFYGDFSRTLNTTSNTKRVSWSLYLATATAKFLDCNTGVCLQFQPFLLRSIYM